MDLEDGAGKLHLLITISGLTQFEPITDLTNHSDPEHQSDNYKNRYLFSDINDIGHLTVKLFCAKVNGDIHTIKKNPDRLFQYVRIYINHD